MSSNKQLETDLQFKGIFYNGNPEKAFYEHGAHFSHDELVICLQKLQLEQKQIIRNKITQLFKLNSSNYKRLPKKIISSTSTRNKNVSTPKNISTISIINNNNINLTNFNVNVNVNLYHHEIDSSIIKSKNKDNGRNSSLREKKLNWSISQPFQISHPQSSKSNTKVIITGKTPLKNHTRNPKVKASNSNNHTNSANKQLITSSLGNKSLMYKNLTLYNAIQKMKTKNK